MWEQTFSPDARRKPRKILVRIVVVLARIRYGYLPNTNQEIYGLSEFALANNTQK